MHRTIRKVTEDIERIHYNTAISATIELLNAAYAQYPVIRDQGPVMDLPTTHHSSLTTDHSSVIDAVETIILLLAPFAPHITEDLWHRRGHPDSVHDQPWPEFDAEIARYEETTVVIQINGKLRDRIVLPTGMAEDELREMALSRERIKQWIEGKEISRVIIVPDKLVNIVVEML
jgi:leucyl-tRNA synthetase